MFLLTIVTARKSSPSMCDVQLPVFWFVRPVALNIGPTRVFASSSLTACLESSDILVPSSYDFSDALHMRSIMHCLLAGCARLPQQF